MQKKEIHTYVIDQDEKRGERAKQIVSLIGKEMGTDTIFMVEITIYRNT